MEFFAKSSPVESIKKHTEALLDRLKEFKRIYGMKLPILSERDWELLELAVKYHDIGKADAVFQNKIRRVIGESLLPENSSFPIPHNLLSVMAIPFKALGLNKEESRLVAQAVAYHHERGILPEKNQILTNYKENILPLKKEIEAHLGVPVDEKPQVSKIARVQKRILPSDEIYYRYILLKGFLHRLDHAASAHVPIEMASEMNVSESVNRFFLKRFDGNKRPLQSFAESHQDHHLVVVAQTGMGKTEAGLLWLGDKKGFFTLPLRVSINSMYSRITDQNNVAFTKRSTEFGEEATGILHSTSLDYLHDHVEGNDSLLEKVHSQSKEFANKLVITTIDQMLKFPFYYLGFEKEYATVATSKVIIDELQAYDPEIAAVLIRALTLIDQIGGSFMIMTATLPDFYYKALQREMKSSKLPLTYKEFIDDTVKRHHIALRKESIIDASVIEKMHVESEQKKVLVICNTVNRACEVYEKLENEGASARLLHSRFIKRDRGELESQLINFANSKESGIWVTTQLVEASLDIDFDVLFTEMSTLDSQFQRYGRCNRKGRKPINEININIYTEEVSGIGKRSVYHPDIHQRSLALLSDHGQGLLFESTKQQMIRDLYDEENLSKSEFKATFDKALFELKNRPHYDVDFNKKKAQDLLRDIHQLQAIPVQFTEDGEFLDVLAKWRDARTRQEKRRVRSAIESFSVGVKMYWAEEIGVSEVEGIKGLYYIHCDYSTKKGLEIEKESIFS